MSKYPKFSFRCPTELANYIIVIKEKNKCKNLSQAIIMIINEQKNPNFSAEKKEFEEQQEFRKRKIFLLSNVTKNLNQLVKHMNTNQEIDRLELKINHLLEKIEKAI